MHVFVYIYIYVYVYVYVYVCKCMYLYMYMYVDGEAHMLGKGPDGTGEAAGLNGAQLGGVPAECDLPHERLRSGSNRSLKGPLYPNL